MMWDCAHEHEQIFYEGGITDCPLCEAIDEIEMLIQRIEELGKELRDRIRAGLM